MHTFALRSRRGVTTPAFSTLLPVVLIMSSFAVPDARAIPVELSPLFPSYIRVDSGVSGAGPDLDQLYLTGLSGSGSVAANSVATDGSGNYSSAALGYTLTNNATAATFAFSYAASTLFDAGSFSNSVVQGTLRFIPGVDLIYAIAGSFGGFVSGNVGARSEVVLREDGATLPDPFREVDKSNLSPSTFDLELNLMQDGNLGPTSPPAGSSLTGLLLAGHEYVLDFRSELPADIFGTDPGEAVGAGTLTLQLRLADRMPPKTDVPDATATATLLGLALLGLAGVRWRVSTAAATS